VTIKTLEEVIQLLEQQNKRIQVLEDVREIANIMGRYIYKHEVHKDAEFLNSIFANRDDISWEVANFGVFYGKKGVKRTLDAHSGIMEGKDRKQAPPPMEHPGGMIMHTLTTPVIEIAGDGKTAKGVWISPGHETGIDDVTGKLRGQWCWTKYGCDFIKEDGKWKLWHYHVYRIFRTPYDMDWTEEYESKREATRKAQTPALPGMTPDFPTTYDNPYTTKYVEQMIPAPPEPYETFDKATSYGPLGK
jgi:hypothetical protein